MHSLQEILSCLQAALPDVEMGKDATEEVRSGREQPFISNPFIEKNSPVLWKY